MKLFKIILLMLCLTFGASYAQDGDFGSGNPDLVEDELLLGNDFTFNIDGEINTASTASNNSNRTTPLRLEDSFITMSAAWKQQIRAVLTAKLEHIFEQNSVEFNNGFSIQEFIREAYIEIRDLGGVPVAVIIGKQPIPFGQNIQAMPLFSSNPLNRLQEINEVYGLTVELTEGLFGIFDQVELSVFETKGGDLELGKIDGLSIRLSKYLTDQWLLTLSHAEMGNSHLNSGHERRTSVGLVGQTEDGDLVGWVEGILFSNNPQYPNSRFALTVGASYRVHRTTEVVLEYSYVQAAVHDLGLAIKTNITKNLSAGAEIRYRNYVERNDHEVIFGISLTYRFGTSGTTQNEEFLFGQEDGEDDDLE